MPKRRLMTLFAGVYVVATTVDAVAWATVRPALPRRPELARLVYEYVPNVVVFAGMRNFLGAAGLEQPSMRRAVIPRGRYAARLVASAFYYGAVERRMSTRR
jgi:hypothetical protein